MIKYADGMVKRYTRNVTDVQHYGVIFHVYLLYEVPHLDLRVRLVVFQAHLLRFFKISSQGCRNI